MCSCQAGRKTVPNTELRALLVSLPVSAWPYGRVVVASDLGLRAVNGSDDQPIKRNHDAAEQILKADLSGDQVHLLVPPSGAVLCI
jgi:hypothetical protein